MPAVSDQRIPKRAEFGGPSYAYPVKSGVVIFGRTFAGITADLEAVPAGHASAVALMGLAESRADARTEKEVRVVIEKGCFPLEVTGATVAKIGQPVYAIDDNTATMDGAGGKLKLGVLEAIDAEGTWVRV